MNNHSDKVFTFLPNPVPGFVTVKAKMAFPSTATETQHAFAVVPDQNYTVLVKGGTDLSATTLTATKDITLSTENTGLTLEGMTMNGAGKTLTLGKPVTLSGALDLVKGVVATTSGNLLTLTPTGTFSAPVTDAYIDGPVRKFGAGNCTFPVGKGGTSAPLKLISIDEPNVAVTVEYFNKAYKNLTYTSPLTGVSHREYWTFSTTSNSLPEILLGSFDPSASGISDIAHVVSAEADPNAGGFLPLGSLPLHSTDNPLYVGGAIHSFPIMVGPVGIYTFGATGAQGFTTTNLSSTDMPNDGHYKASDVLTFIVHFTTDITVTGSPELDFKLGTSTVSAEKTASAGDSIVFSYTVKTGDLDNDGLMPGDVTLLDLNGGTIRDAADNNADLTISGIAGGAGVRIDGVAPVISNVAIPDHVMKVGNTVTATITTVSDADTYTLTSGTIGGFPLSNFSKEDDTHYAATFTITDGSVEIAAGDNIPVNITLKDAAGNEATYAIPIAQSGDPIDASIPKIIQVDLPADKIYTTGEILDFTVHYSEDVTVTDTPVLGLTIGNTPVIATYEGGTGSNALTFRYTVQPGELDQNGITVTSLSGLFADGGGNAVDNTLSEATLGSTSGILVDAAQPAVSSVDVPADKTYAAGEVLTFTVNFGEPVIVTGTDATLNLTIGSTSRNAAYVSGSDSSLIFSYAVQPGELDSDGIEVNSMSFNSTTITDMVGNGALSLLKGIAATTDVRVDALPPVIVADQKFSVTENSAMGTGVGIMLTTKPESSKFPQWKITGGNTGDAFAVNSTTGAITVSNSGELDYEKTAAYTLTLTVSDMNGTSGPQDVTITIGNVSEAPTDISLDNMVINENNAPDAVIGKFSSADEDAGSTFSYTLVSGTGDADNASFSINADGQLLAAKAFDFETKSSYSIRVKSTDNGGLSFEKTFVISIGNVSEAPFIGVIDDTSICETAPGIIPIGGISGGTVTDQPYTLAVKSDNVIFNALSIGPGKDGKATIHYTLKSNGEGASHITVTITNNGDHNSFSRVFTLTVNPQPVISITGDTDQVSKGDIVQLQASGGATYSWAPAAGIVSGQDDAILAVRPIENTTYHVTAYSMAGCSSGKDVNITIKDDYNVQAANILTPNGDGRNDTWVIKNIDSYPNNEVSIFDRSGRMIYHKKGYSNDWNGTINGQPLHEGAYYYLINFGNGKKIIKGYISIIMGDH